MAKPRALAFNPIGAEAKKGGTHEGRLCGRFQIWYVINANGVVFRRCSYVPGGWKASRPHKDGTPHYTGGVWYRVKAQLDIGMLNQYVRVAPYAGPNTKPAEDF